MILPPFEYVECTSIEEVIDALGDGDRDARIVAGGTVVMPMMKHDLLRPDVLVSLERVAGLDGVEQSNGELTIGALARHREVSRSESVRETAPMLAQACGLVASPVIRSMGSLGGNLCYGESASDPSPVLLALNARLHVFGPNGTRTVPIEDFFVGFYETAVGPGEVLTHVEIPRQPRESRWTYRKWTPRAREDKPLIGLAATIRPDGAARLAVGGINPTPVLLESASVRASDSDLSEREVNDVADAAATEVDPFEDLQGSEEYRREMVRVWVGRVLRSLREVEVDR